MASPNQNIHCGIVGPIVAFVVLAALVQWIGTQLLGQNVGGTLVTALLLGGIGVHILCTYNLERKRRAMGG
ncbi:hypothetical protein [Thiohalorhabdus methylotrophus]|uniref:Uncharacterized protein n=1 Tax=Thiohalorhabdus methylotrophus TaxID=3242694 RepID=A0ABV4TSG3_9GAMM